MTLYMSSLQWLSICLINPNPACEIQTLGQLLFKYYLVHTISPTRSSNMLVIEAIRKSQLYLYELLRLGFVLEKRYKNAFLKLIVIVAIICKQQIE